MVGNSENKRWRVTALTNFPKGVFGTSPPAPGELMPPTIGLFTRIPAAKRVQLAGREVILCPYSGPPLPTDVILDVNWQASELAALAIFTDATTPREALVGVEDMLEQLLDSISFQVQVALRVFQLEVLDVTPPLELKMIRQVLHYPFPLGYPSPKFFQSLSLGSVDTDFYPGIRLLADSVSVKTRAALRWYVKGLAATYDIDRFMCFWVALEILWSESNVSVEEPYRCLKCRSMIPKCDNCGRSTTKQVRGASIKQFLAGLGLDAMTAKVLWDFRQLVHGVNKLRAQDLLDLPRLILSLREASVTALKAALLWDRGRPAITRGGPDVAVSLGLEGTRPIESFDLGF
jgi:hypothetical protein